MTDIADKFIEKLKNSKSKKQVDLLIIINRWPEAYSICSDNGKTKIMVSQNTNDGIMCQMKNYLNSLKKNNFSRYNYCDFYGFIQTELTAKEAMSLYKNNLFKDKIVLLPGDLTVILKP